MKKSLLIVATLALGTAAIAQDAPPAGAPPMANTPGQPASDAPPMANTPGQPAPGAGAMPAGPESQTPPPPAGNDPSAMPPPPGGSGAMSGGGMSGGNMSSAQQMASSTDTSNYPKCSRGVTDKCVQAGGTAHSGKRMMRKHR